MSEPNNGGPAFPSSYATPTGPQPYDDNHGMTLRDYFAAAALTIAVKSVRQAVRATQTQWPMNVAEQSARLAYEMADAMLKERNAGNGASLPQGEPLTLLREPDNKFDPGAVQVWARGQHIGYVNPFRFLSLALTRRATWRMIK